LEGLAVPLHNKVKIQSGIYGQFSPHLCFSNS
jgi:hypothetical protein